MKKYIIVYKDGRNTMIEAEFFEIQDEIMSFYNNEMLIEYIDLPLIDFITDKSL